jgi:CRP-like cAMP-binding protein
VAADPGRTRITRELLFAAFAGPSTETDDPRLLDRLAAAVEAETVGPGRVLFRQGEESTHVHFMTEGRMRLSCEGRPDWVYEGRWVVGTTDVLAGRPHSRTAVMETDSRLFRLPANRWFEVMDHRPDVLLNALVGFARGVAALHVQLAPDGGFALPAPRPSLVVSSLAARARLLASASLLQGVPMQSLVELAHESECRDLEPEEILFAAGALPGRVFVVTRGRVEARRVGPDVSAVFAAGSIVGGALCLGDSEGAWSARALDKAQVLSFSTADLFDHVEEHQGGVRAMMGAFALERERICDILAARQGELVLR